MADNSGMSVVIRRSDETVIETVSTNDELNILKASGAQDPGRAYHPGATIVPR